MRIQILILGLKVWKIASVQQWAARRIGISEKRGGQVTALWQFNCREKIISWLNFLFLSSMCTSLLYSAWNKLRSSSILRLEECDEYVSILVVGRNLWRYIDVIQTTTLLWRSVEKGCCTTEQFRVSLEKKKTDGKVCYVMFTRNIRVTRRWMNISHSTLRKVL